MNVAPVDRLGAWLPSGSDPRTAAASRVQTVAASGSTASASLPLGSATELPVLAIKEGNTVQGQTVPAPGTGASQAAGATAASVSPEPTPTVDAFPNTTGSGSVVAPAVRHTHAGSSGASEASGTSGISGSSAGSGTPGAAGTAGATNAAGQAQSASSAAVEHFADTTWKPLDSPATADEKARAAAKAAVSQQAKQAPPGAAARVLIDVMHSVWAASGHAVISNAADLSGNSAKDLASTSSTSSTANATSTATQASTATAQAALSAYNAVSNGTDQSSSS